MNEELEAILNGRGGMDVIYLRVPYSFKEYFVRMAEEQGLSHRDYGKIVKEVLTQFIQYREQQKREESGGNENEQKE